jgi:hypothetical protein
VDTVLRVSRTASTAPSSVPRAVVLHRAVLETHREHRAVLAAEHVHGSKGDAHGAPLLRVDARDDCGLSGGRRPLSPPPRRRRRHRNCDTQPQKPECAASSKTDRADGSMDLMLAR